MLRGVPEAAAATALPSCSGNASGDFDGNGFSDLAVGIPGDDTGGSDAGAVRVVLGSAAGLTSTGTQLITQNSDQVEDTSEAGDLFGACVAAGDINGDGKDDLVVGVPGEDIGAIVDAGAINIIFGTNNGLNAAGPPVDQFYNQNSAGILGASETSDEFGASVVAGQFDDDEFADVAIGAPLEDIGSGTTAVADAGSVNVLYGGAAGLRTTGDQLIFQNAADVAGTSETGDHFGKSLASGDLDGDGPSDLIVGVPEEDIGSAADGGCIHVFYGSERGLTKTRDKVFHQNISGVEDTTETGDRYGQSVTAGDFDGDGNEDVAAGVPGEDASTVLTDTGLVSVLFGTDTGLKATDDRALVAVAPGAAAAGDQFGAAVAASDVAGTTDDDLIVGAPFRDSAGPVADTGAYYVFNSATGVPGFVVQTAWAGEDALAGDRFGTSLTTGNYNGVGISDLAVGAPNEDVGAKSDAGVVDVAYSGGIPGNQGVAEDTLGGSSDAGDLFGSSIG